MKRFHVHVSVEDLAAAVRFYSTLFDAAPSVRRPAYAKWMLEDPRVNFAISQRGHAAGVNHLGFQVQSTAELRGLRAQLQAADEALLEQHGQSCCYARSDKYWITDPAGIAWESFHTLESVPVFGDDVRAEAEGSACCIPLAGSAGESRSACCVPTGEAGGSACCPE